MSEVTHIEAGQVPPKTRSKSANRSFESLLLPASLVCLVAFWDIMVRYFSVPAYIIPAPVDVAYALFRIFSGQLFWTHFGITLFETVCGFVLAFAMAMFVAILMTVSRIAEKLLYPYIAALQSMPKIAIAPLVILWFGFGLQSKIVLAALLCFFPMLVNFATGLQATDELRLRLLHVLDASPRQVIWLVRLPSAMPFVLAGVELGAIYAMLGAIVGEFVGARAGIGYWLMQMNATMDTAGSFALLVVLAAYGVLVQRFLRFARRKLLFWYASERATAKSN
jgi:NitT/TauT family transport system permease protein